jgi:hypothetical protein
MKKIAFIVFITVELALRAQVISWNADSYGTISGPNAAGVVPAANWNDSWLQNGNAISPYGSPTVVNGLTDSSGTSTTLSLSYQAWGFWNIQGSAPGQDADGSYNRNLLNGYLNAGPAGWGPPVTNSTITLSQIPYSQYDLYVYFSSDVAGRNGSITVGTLTYYFSSVGAASVSGANASFVQTTDTTGANPAANYAVFSGLSGGSQTLTCNALSGNDQWLGIAGFQLVAIPEPSCLAFLAIGVAGWIVRPGKKPKSN